MVNLIFYFLDYLIILPAAFMCVLPVLSHSRIKPAILLPSMSAGTVIFSFMLAFVRYKLVPNPNIPLAVFLVMLAFVRYKLVPNPNIPLAVFLVFALLFFFFTFDVKIFKLWYIFISVVSVMSFGGLSTFIIDAMLDHSIELIIELAVKWGVSLLFFLFEFLYLTKLRWLVDNENISTVWRFIWLIPMIIAANISTVWRFIWLIPMIIAAANMLMIPENNANVRVGKVFQLYIIIEILFAAFYVIFLIMLYRIAKAINDKAESEHNAQLLGLQAAQYDNLKKYLDSTSRLRHDFVYMAKTAQTLAANGETEQLRQLLSDYGSSIDATSAPAFYCDNKALNAITDYYVNDARRKGIKLTAKLNVARDIVISEKAAEPNSEILFVADTKKNGDLYIAVSNPYSGEIKEKGGKFSSTKAGGHGIGLESIRAIVQKNNGYCNFRYDKKKFYSEIMLRQG